MELARMHITRTELLGNHFLARRQRQVGQVNAVRTHIGYFSALVQRLCETHGLGNGEFQFACRLLLERRGGERRRGQVRDRLALYVPHNELRPIETLEELNRIFLMRKTMVQFASQNGRVTRI